MKYFIAGVTLLTLCILMVHCKKNAQSTQSFAIAGTVQDESGNTLSGASVQVDGKTTMTDGSGHFTFSGVAQASVYKLQADLSGYFTSYKNLPDVNGGSINATLVMLIKTNVGSINGTSGGTISSGGMQIVAPANAFKNSDGSLYTGVVTINARYIPKTDTAIAQVMPGGDFMATNASGQLGGLRTYGFIVTEFDDQDGNVLTGQSGINIGIVIPSGVDDPLAGGATCWGYDPTSGTWGNSSDLSESGGICSLGYIANYENVDTYVQYGKIIGQVVCVDGKPSAYGEVTITNQYDQYQAFINADGYYEATVEITSHTGAYTITSAGSPVTVANVAQGQTTTAPLITVPTCSSGTGATSGGSGTLNFMGTVATGTGACNIAGPSAGVTESAVYTNTYVCALLNPGNTSINAGDFDPTGDCYPYKCGGLEISTLTSNPTLYIGVSGSITATSSGYTFTGTVASLTDYLNYVAGTVSTYQTYSVSGTINCN